MRLQVPSAGSQAVPQLRNSEMPTVDELLDMVDLSRPQAEAVLVWHEAAASEACAEAVSDSVFRLLAWLLEDDKTRLRALGLAYACARPDLAGGITLDDAAKREKIAANTMANWRDRAIIALRGTPGKESSTE